MGSCILEREICFLEVSFLMVRMLQSLQEEEISSSIVDPSESLAMLACCMDHLDFVNWVQWKLADTNMGIGTYQCSRLKSSMPFKCDLALQNMPFSKQPFKTQPLIEIEDITWSQQYNLPAARTHKCMALSLQELELGCWFLILHIVLKTCTK